MTDKLLIAMDGPAGVGKSTAARGLARRLGIPYVDTGAMYRAMALACLRRGVDLQDEAGVAAIVADAEIEVDHLDGVFRVVLDGVVLGDEIRTPEVSLATSRVSTHAAVRRRLVELQRRFGREYGGVFEGRDIGSVVFPQARHKFFMEASARVRAERRLRELEQRGEQVSLKELERQMQERDARDRSRALSPLQADETYVVVDTGDLDAEGVLDVLVRSIESREPGALTRC